MDRPVIIGGGGHARSLIAMAPEALRPLYYVDPEERLGLVRLGDDDAFLADSRFTDVPVIIGYVATNGTSMAVRRRIIERYAGRRFATIVADDATVAPDAVLGRGTAVFHRAVVNTGAFLGDHVVVNTAAVVEHDVTVGENTFIGPGAVLCGGVTVGRDVFIGAGAVLRPGVSVCDGATVAMGAAVFRNIRKPGVYIGNPAELLTWKHSS